MHYYFLVFVLLIFSSVVKGQYFSGGIYTGLVASQIDGDTFKGYNKMGLTTGAFVNCTLNEKMSAQMGIRYSNKGSQQTSNTESYKCKLQYIALPVTIRYQQYKKIDFETGISIGYLIKQSEFFNGYIDNNALEFNKFDLGAIVGVNYCFTEKLSLGIHFEYSVLHVRPFSENYSILENNQHNNAVSFTVAYQINSK